MKADKKSKKARNSFSTGFCPAKKCQGLPMYAIGILIIGIIILAIVLIFIFGVSGQGMGILDKLFSAQGNVTSEASETAAGLAGNFFR